MKKNRERVTEVKWKTGRGGKTEMERRMRDIKTKSRWKDRRGMEGSGLELKS